MCIVSWCKWYVDVQFHSVYDMKVCIVLCCKSFVAVHWNLMGIVSWCNWYIDVHKFHGIAIVLLCVKNWCNWSMVYLVSWCNRNIAVHSFTV